MIDILKSELPINGKNFWYDIGVELTHRINGVVQILFNDMENSIIVKIFIEKFNYSINMSFNRWEFIDKYELLNNILDFVRDSIYEQVLNRKENKKLQLFGKLLL